MSARRRIPEILSALVMLGMLLATISQIHAQTRDTGASRNTILPIVQASAPAVPSTADFRVTLLGTATPAPRPDRFGPSTLVEAGSERLVFDCGRSCTTRLWQLKIPLGSVKLFITHLRTTPSASRICGLRAGCRPLTEVERNLLRCLGQRAQRK
jgi:hypothetical protein